MRVERLEQIVTRNQRALRDMRNRLVWVAVVVCALVAVGVAVALGLGMPSHTKKPAEPATAPVEPAHAHDHVDGVLMRRAR